MAVMTGAEAGRKILPFGPEVKIVFISADEHTREESMKAGAVDFMWKSVIIREMLDCIESILRAKELVIL